MSNFRFHLKYDMQNYDIFPSQILTSECSWSLNAESDIWSKVHIMGSDFRWSLKSEPLDTDFWTLRWLQVKSEITPCFMQFVLASPEAWILRAMPEIWASFTCTLKSVPHSETCLSQLFDEYSSIKGCISGRTKETQQDSSESWKLKAEYLDSALPRPWLSAALVPACSS